MNEHHKPLRLRWGHWWLPVLLLAIMFLALLAFCGWWYETMSPMAKLKASGAPVSFEDLASRPASGEGNAAVLLRSIRPTIEVLPKAVADLAHAANEGPLTNDQRQKAEKFLAEYADELSTLDAAAKVPSYTPYLSVERLADDQAMLDDARFPRSAARLITLRTRVALANDQIPRAVDSVASSLRLAKHFEQEPFLINRLVACAVQHMALNDANAIISADALSEDHCRLLDAACAAIEDRSGYREMLVTERVLSLEKFAQFPLFVQLKERPSVLRVYEKAIANTPAMATGASIRKPAISTVGGLAANVLPALQAAREYEKRIAALAHCVRIRIALRDAEPDGSTDAATLGVPDSTLLDPFTGDRLVIQHRSATGGRKAGWWVYSVGSNEVDDGGKFEDVSDVGYAPPLRR